MKQEKNAELSFSLIVLFVVLLLNTAVNAQNKPLYQITRVSASLKRTAKADGLPAATTGTATSLIINDTPKPSATRYFLNKQEISPQSVFFLNEDDIDSIGEYVNPDTSIVFYIHKPKKIISYKQLVKRYQLEQEVLKFPLSINSARKISKPELMVFSTDMVVDISIHKIESEPKRTYLYIQAASRRWERDSKRAFSIVKIKRKLNDI